MNLIIGSAQFGLDYGITNSYGKTTVVEIHEILKYAEERSIEIIDTAPSYGDSEISLGKQDLHTFEIYSKTPYIKNAVIDDNDIQFVDITLKNTLKNLNVDLIKGLLVHSVMDLKKNGFSLLYNWMLQQKKNGYLKEIGVSIYDEADLNILNQYDFDVIQLPTNIVDQRFSNIKRIQKLHDNGVKIYARSVFLQGILLENQNQLKKQYPIFYRSFKSYYDFLNKYKLTPLEATLAYLHQQDYIDGVVVGISNLSQLKEIVEIKEKIDTLDKKLPFNECAITNLEIIDPRRWK